MGLATWPVEVHMSKLAWVALPLIIVAALLGVQALRRRTPSRLALNVVSSLLLLVYLAVTAGLGIFWVAHQQLPVFDWHYLFGYTTVTLVVLHLVFNLPTVWRFLTGRRTAVSLSHGDGPAGVARDRRWLLGAGGLVLWTGATFALGLRHGRSELRFDGTSVAAGTIGGGTAPGASPSAMAMVERFHAFSSHSRTGALLRAPSVDWGDPPPPFKPAGPGLSGVTVGLPPPGAAARRAAQATSGGISDAASGTTSNTVSSAVSAAAPDLQALSTMLWHTAGVTEARTALKLRASPSSGGLFSTELYVAVRAVVGLEPGWWHYQPASHALTRVRAGTPEDDALGVPGGAGLNGAPVAIVATALFGRTGHKYRDRTYRYVWADLGHALENLRVAAGEVGARARLLDRFDESRIASSLGLDEREEGVLALVALDTAGRRGGDPSGAPPGTAPGAPSSALADQSSGVLSGGSSGVSSGVWPGRSSHLPPGLSSGHRGAVVPRPQGRAATGVRWQPLAPRADPAAPLGVTDAMHNATSLRAVELPVVPPSLPSPPSPAMTSSSTSTTTPTTPSTPTTPTSPTMPESSGPPGPVPGSIALPSAPVVDASLLDVIARRRSVRRHASTPVPLVALSGVLAGLHPDAPLLSTAVRVDVVVHAVDGLARGVYRFNPVGHALVPRRQTSQTEAGLRAATRAAALDQDVIGDAAVVFVLAVVRDEIASDPVGPARGYRHAFIEAGLVGERIYLEAGARGLGACAVGAFYDEEAAALVGSDPAHEWVVHFAALGIPSR